MKKHYKSLLFLLLTSSICFSQVGVGTNVPAGALDITSTTNGIVIPRVILTAKNVAAPVVNPQGGALVSGTLVWNTNTAGTIPNNVIPGFYYWDALTSAWIAVGGTNSNNWTLNGNTGVNGGNATTAGTNYIGTTDNQNLDIHTNNTYVARFSSLGEFFLGTLSTTLPGDLMNGVGNASFPFAVNGYTSYNGAGVYGQRQGTAAGIWGSVQGETPTTLAANNSGVAGLASATSHRGVLGQKPAGGLGWGGLFINDLGYTGGAYNASDRRLKKNIKPLDHALGILNSIPLYTYNFKTELYDNVGDDGLHYGVMADELKRIVPSLVRTKSITPSTMRDLSGGKQMKGPDFDIEMVNYTELIPIVIQGIKEQQTIIEDQNQRIAKLEKIILELQNRK